MQKVGMTCCVREVEQRIAVELWASHIAATRVHAVLVAFCACVSFTLLGETSLLIASFGACLCGGLEVVQSCDMQAVRCTFLGVAAVGE